MDEDTKDILFKTYTSEGETVLDFTMGSLFDGIGGWPLAAVKCGFNPVWSSEIENFPVQVTERHFPNMKQLGDITKIDGTKIEPVDIITFGSPCQDLSIAGKRGGLKGARSSLFGEAIRIIREMQRATEGKYPRFAIWENVPGAFSSNKGLDFRTVLEEITEAKIPMPQSKRWATAGMVRSSKCEVAWRVLDAQYWGVPQRRKRIFLVADFGGCCAAEVLFKPESVSRYFAEGCGEREGVAGNLAVGVGATIEREIVVQPIPINDKATRYKGGGDSRNNDGSGNGLGVGKPGDPMATLTACDRHAVCSVDCRNLNENQEISGTLQSKSTGGYSLNYQNPVRIGYKVRHLTPTECERLQGLPDGWTNLPGASDTARYKALGNGMAQPCADYVMQGIAEILKTGGSYKRSLSEICCHLFRGFKHEMDAKRSRQKSRRLWFW